MYKYLFFCRCAIGQSSVSSEMERIFNKVSNNFLFIPSMLALTPINIGFKAMCCLHGMLSKNYLEVSPLFFFK